MKPTTEVSDEVKQVIWGKTDFRGAVDIKGRTTPQMLTVKNTLTAEHGFAIDSMKIKEVIKPGEEKTITVPLENIDKTVSEHRVYCQLHPKHVAATLKVTGN